MHASRHLTAIAAFILILLGAFGLFYVSGWRISSGFSIAKTTSLSVEPTLANATVILDGKVKGVVEGSPFAVAGVLPGFHTLLVVREGYWPWSKAIEVPEHGGLSVAPFAVPDTPQGEVVDSDDPAYATLRSAFAARTPETAERPATSADGVVSAWVEGTVVVASHSASTTPPFFCGDDGCAEEFTVFHSVSPIRGVGFLGNRNDVLLIATQNAIYALELDERGTQNFQPVYRGIDPVFLPGEHAGELYVRDANTFIRLRF